MTKNLGFLMVLLILSAGASATILRVPEDYPEGIQRAILVAANGDTVSVRPGTAQGPEVYSDTLNFDNKDSILVAARNSPTAWEWEIDNPDPKVTLSILML